jgi:filamentous hemagglutinin family protein
MVQSCRSWSFRLASYLTIAGVIIISSGNKTFAQNSIVPDDTLGNENSVVTPTVIKGFPGDEIEGGAQRGANLFHSFSEFNVGSGRGVYFLNPTGIENIFSRVTGANPSEILGTLGVLGNANLFLINPNGIIFGENARLDVGGSFVGTTADGVRLGETGIFSASEPETSNLLTVNPSALFFNQMAAGEIINRSQAFGLEGETNSVGLPVGLQVASDQTLALVGGDVTLEAGNLTAAGGSIELGSVVGVGEVSLRQSGQSWRLEYDETNAFGNILLQDGSFIDASGAGGGDVKIQGARFEMTGGSFLYADTIGSEDGGEIFVRTTEAVTLSGGSFLTADVFGSGIGGDVKIETRQLTVRDDETRISASTFGSGNGGNLKIETEQLIVRDGVIGASTLDKGDGGAFTIKATELIEVVGGTSALGTQAIGAGAAGDLIIETKQLLVRDGAQVGAGVGILGEGNGGSLLVNATELVELIGVSVDDGTAGGLFTQTQGAGDAGDLTLETKQLIVRDGARISSATLLGEGDGGALTIKATESVAASGTSADGRVFSGLTTQTEGAGDAGDLTLETKQLIVQDGAQISASTFDEGDGGALTVKATESVQVIGESADGQFGSSLVAGTRGAGDAGDLTLETKQLIVRDGAQISANTFDEGDGGALTVKATESVQVIGRSQNERFPSALLSSVESGATGDANNLNISTKHLLVSDGAVLAADSRGQGNAGDLTVNTSQLTLQNQGRLLVSGQGDFNPGNLTLTADNITLDNQSSIEANTESGSQGNITLNTDNLLTLRRESKITTNATGTATGGNITINANDGFIVAVPNENSDITANATQATGGRVFIDATSLYGIEPREEQTSQSDITASSELGSEFSGIVEIDTPNVDPERDLVQLPTQPVETEIVQACAPSNREEQSEFIITGRGGLPPSPEDLLDSDALAVDWVTRNPQTPNSPPEISPSTITPETAPIIEAQGWTVNENHEIVLIAHTPPQNWLPSPQCQQKAEGRGQEEQGRNHSPLPPASDENILIASTEPKLLTAKIPERITVNRFDLKGNQVFDSEELAKVLTPYTNKPLSFAELLQARRAITEYYTQRGYITSGAYIPPQKLENQVVTLQVVEGTLEDIEITGNQRLNSDYVSSRIETAIDQALQQEALLSALQLLQQDPLIASLSAELKAGTRPGASVLAVEIREADSFSTPILLDNRRTPSVGSFRRQVGLQQGNLLGFGDELFVAYSNTEGSEAFDGSYAIPVNPRNGTLSVRGGLSSSEVIEEPFDQLNILGDSQYYELSLRQPLLRTPTQEFALGITASRRSSDISSLLDEFDVPPAELSPGADADGQTQVSALRFFQEWTSRSSNQVFALRSQLSWGLGVLGATVNEQGPDSRFLAWQGQAQWVRQLAPDTLLLLRGGIQLAMSSLLPSEQLGLGGLDTVRGYRQDLLLSDNAALASVEIRLPILRWNERGSVLQIAPFFDVGTAWTNGEEREVANPNTLAAVGLGLRLSLFNGLTARLDWGFPLIAVDVEANTWQENGFYFSVESSPF